MSDDLAPRRSARKPKPTQREAIPVVETVPSKRKAKDDVADPTEQLRFMLQNPKSRLTNMDISDLINANAWNMLSPDSQSRLSACLPPTAFSHFQPSIGPDHPAAVNSMSIDPNRSSPVDISFFTDAHFLAAAHTFQDHLYSNWLSDAHAEKVKKYEQGIRDGTLAAPWKDEVWERDNHVAEPATGGTGFLSSSPLAGDAAELKLVDLAKSSVLREGDVLTYKRSFTNVDIIVEKDVIVQRIDPRTHSLTVLLEPGPRRDLPAELLMPGPSEPEAPTRTMTITSPTQLESGLLDVDGRVERTKRPNGNAWKSFTLWRWSGDSLETAFSDNGPGRRGGRQDHGTLFYLRACYYQDR
ncbi:Asx homology domain-containing protein [Mycena alexandri]|uniref:Asx homology domain-containing protein n=1 Tax=Mycena alexandri TaxID=1745969 RepID=A0AAD6STL2_9AGAR|nr:Asx homology domain-containing protein [Mycena alexandri]